MAICRMSKLRSSNFQNSCPNCSAKPEQERSPAFCLQLGALRPGEHKPKPSVKGFSFPQPRSSFEKSIVLTFVQSEYITTMVGGVNEGHAASLEVPRKRLGRFCSQIRFIAGSGTCERVTLQHRAA
jgi:hypothetical protein